MSEADARGAKLRFLSEVATLIAQSMALFAQDSSVASLLVGSSQQWMESVPSLAALLKFAKKHSDRDRDVSLRFLGLSFLVSNLFRSFG